MNEQTNELELAGFLPGAKNKTFKLPVFVELETTLFFANFEMKTLPFMLGCGTYGSLKPFSEQIVKDIRL